MRPTPVAPPGYIHLGNWAKLAQFVTGLIVGSRGTNGAFATASAASGGPCRLRRTRPAGWAISVTLNQPARATGQVSLRIDQQHSSLFWSIDFGP
jgi:hypothetical protein